MSERLCARCRMPLIEENEFADMHDPERCSELLLSKLDDALDRANAAETLEDAFRKQIARLESKLGSSEKLLKEMCGHFKRRDERATALESRLEQCRELVDFWSKAGSPQYRQAASDLSGILTADSDELIVELIVEPPKIRDGEIVDPPILVEGNPVRSEDPIKAAFVERKRQ